MEMIALIEKYIVHLITECGLSVTVHPIERESFVTFSRLMRFNIHDNSYCTQIKSTPDGQRRCLEQQKKVLEKCREGGCEFCGVCHAGVFEYVYPFFDKEGVVGFVSVGGYASASERSRVKHAAKRFGYAEDTLTKAYEALRPSAPDKKRIDVLVLPLCKMLELTYYTQERGTTEEDLIERICRYVRHHYARDLTTKELCETFYCSRSLFSHTFKKKKGMSFREYLTDIRLEYAKRLLRYSSLTVTEISFSVGFNDANYFSNVFRKRVGCSPLRYRKTKKPQ